jgi:hypothetical protein
VKHPREGGGAKEGGGRERKRERESKYFLRETVFSLLV